VDVLACPTCGGLLEAIAFIAEQSVARRILDHLGQASQKSPLAGVRAQDEGADADPGPDSHAAEGTPED